MCLGIPGEIQTIRVEDDVRMATVRFAGVTRDVCLECLPEAKVGDYVLVHVGFAIAAIDRAEAERALAVLTEIGQTEELDS